MNLCDKQQTCILCNSYDLIEVFQLADSALAENYSFSLEEEERYPLHLMRCANCGNVQLQHVVNQEYLFRNYFYETVSSPGLVEHFNKYAEYFAKELKLNKDSVIVDIGGNDGSLLLSFVYSCGTQNVINVEASNKLSGISRSKGIFTLNEFWSRECGERIEKLFGKVDLITANNVFAHSRDFQEQMKVVYDLLKPEGTFVMEVSYLPDLILNRVFDFIYHEHLIYHSYLPLKKCLQHIGLRIIGYERNSMKGGSIRFTIVRAGSERTSSPDLSDLVRLENDIGLTKECLQLFIENINKVRGECFSKLEELHNKGAKIVGFGASATTTTLLHHFQIGQYLCGLVDDNLNKNGMYSPGYNLPVMHPDMLPRIAPDFIFIIAWRFAEQIMKKYPQYIGKFIIPLPEYRIV